MATKRKARACQGNSMEDIQQAGAKLKRQNHKVLDGANGLDTRKASELKYL